MTEPDPKSQKEKPETDLTEEELEKASGGLSLGVTVAQPMPPPIRPALSPLDPALAEPNLMPEPPPIRGS
jgi:hypothetical protein